MKNPIVWRGPDGSNRCTSDASAELRPGRSVTRSCCSFISLCSWDASATGLTGDSELRGRPSSRCLSPLQHRRCIITPNHVSRPEEIRYRFNCMYESCHLEVLIGLVTALAEDHIGTSRSGRSPSSSYTPVLVGD